MTEYERRTDRGPQAAHFFSGLAWDLLMLAVLVIALVWTWSSGVKPGIVLVIGIGVALGFTKALNRVLHYNRTAGPH